MLFTMVSTLNGLYIYAVTCQRVISAGNYGNSPDFMNISGL